MKTMLHSNRVELLDASWVHEFISGHLKQHQSVILLDRRLSRTAKAFGMEYTSIEECLAQASILHCWHIDVNTFVNEEKSQLTFEFSE